MAIPIFSDDLTMEILSWLPVICLLKFKCVSKSFYSLISDPIFVKLHLQRSPKTANFLVEYRPEYSIDGLMRNLFFSCPKSSLLDNSLSQIAENNEYRYIDPKYHDYQFVIGSCNGLVCLYAEPFSKPFFNGRIQHKERTFLLWNPATRQRFGDPQKKVRLSDISLFGFGYDNVSDTYKVVAILFTEDGSLTSSNEVKVCNISENGCWRNILSFPAYIPFQSNREVGVYLKSTLNWIAFANTHDPSDICGSNIRFGEMVIVSLDLGSETYTQFSLPSALSGDYSRDYNYTAFKYRTNWDEILGVLKDCLCLFLYDTKTCQLTIWQMKEFGNEKSWNPLLIIFPHRDLQIPHITTFFNFQPLCVFEDGTLLLIFDEHCSAMMKAIWYDGRDNTVKHSDISNRTIEVYTYVESLVCPRKY